MAEVLGVGLKVLSVLLVTACMVAMPLQAAQASSGPDWRAVLVGEVSGGNIMEYVVELESLFTRDFHTDGATQAASMIEQWMQEIGLETSLQWFVADGFECVNVIGSLNPDSDDAGTVLFGAHYDSRNRYAATVSEAENVSAPGADDNASGIGAMLEIARILAGCEAYDARTRFVAFGAEERGFENKSGLAGSAAYVRSEADVGTVYDATFIMDMIGFQAEDGSRMTIVHDDGSQGVADSVLAAVDGYGLTIAVDVVANDSIAFSDHASFWSEGYPSVLAVEQLSPQSHSPVNPYYHSEFDTSDKLSVDQMEAVASALLGAALDLTEKGEDSYSSSQSLVALAVVAAVVAFAAIIISRMRRGV